MLFDAGLELLTEPECYELIRDVRVGRVGVTVGALPVILPVNYACVEGDVVFRTAEGTKLRAAVDRAVVAFEVDEYDPAARTGWSVLLVGEAREVVTPDEIAMLEATDLEPWTDADGRSRWVRLRPEFVSGRRIATPVAIP
jgi:nitroimidazol reductase NimA-like FMN-containing flavoprotein (pyridoxamine 5'-phosphate oxidase superfamily)